MKINVSINFDFGKLSGKLNNIIDEYTAEFAKDSERGSKIVIDSGILPKLKSSTEKWRRSQGYPIRPPLKASGKLYNSIKAEKNVLKIIQYGKWHNDGKVPTTVARKFITTTHENKKKIDKDFIRNLNKALRSKVRVASLG